MALDNRKEYFHQKNKNKKITREDIYVLKPSNTDLPACHISHLPVSECPDFHATITANAWPVERACGSFAFGIGNEETKGKKGREQETNTKEGEEIKRILRYVRTGLPSFLKFPFLLPFSLIYSAPFVLDIERYMF